MKNNKADVDSYESNIFEFLHSVWRSSATLVALQDNNNHKYYYQKYYNSNTKYQKQQQQQQKIK